VTRKRVRTRVALSEQWRQAVGTKQIYRGLKQTASYRQYHPTGSETSWRWSNAVIHGKTALIRRRCARAGVSIACRFAGRRGAHQFRMRNAAKVVSGNTGQRLVPPAACQTGAVDIRSVLRLVWGWGSSVEVTVSRAKMVTTSTCGRRLWAEDLSTPRSTRGIDFGYPIWSAAITGPLMYMALCIGRPTIRCPRFFLLSLQT
jgi:hypothetical protein